MAQSPFTYFESLECSLCHRRFDPRQVQTYCPDCKVPLVSNYDFERARQELVKADVQAGRGMWRWHALLPMFSPGKIVTLGEGDTPLLPLHRLEKISGLSNLSVKDEGLNPTGSFKARGLAAAISKANELGIEKVIIPTAGNAGGAMAAYAAAAGMKAAVYMPRDTPIANQVETRITGAEVILVDGLISDAARLAGERAAREGWFDVSTFKEPYRLEGKKVMGFEIAEQYQWDLPDVILYPTGGGTGLVGIWKAIQELEKLGWLATSARPKMVAVQAAGCAPVVRAWLSGAATCEFWQGAQTIASGLRVPKSFADRLILQTISASGGTAVAVTDEEILTAQQQLASQEGLFVAPEGAATLAGLLRLQAEGWIKPGQKILLLNTGMGLKYING